ncbi:alpha/beta-hydrolase [Polyplosphaeria fusca]|uniref:Alpha/beta-hydrolase n=1 Tax=Polyplosphaeria fusca TaxID=682080 RepID=A0A9P4V5L6_9PLEO|nr:alpha/beta-hydrolase [Polyplosphaeria fusca]
MTTSAGTPHTRQVFYVGGQYTTVQAGAHVFKDQMYIEQLTPLNGSTKPYPLVFFHGSGQTGVNWLTTPDDRPGWTSYFLAHGFECYVVDIPARGRSPWLLGTSFNLSDWTQASAEMIQQRFTAPENYKLWPSATLHTQWPSGFGKGVMGDPIFDAYFATTATGMTEPVQQQTVVQAAGAALLDRIGKPVIIVGHSEGGKAPWVIADTRPELVKKIVALEPSGPPFQNSIILDGKPARAYGLTDIPLAYDPPVTNPAIDLVKVRVAASEGQEDCLLQADEPPPRQLVNLKKIKTALLTAEASYHTLHDWCTVKYLKQAGVDVEAIELAKIGIKGNGHMFMLEKNSDDIAEVVRRWIEE